jgi:CspA family cold shock protein
MTTGTVKKLVPERGFGFITSDDGKDYFFHRSVLAPTLDFDRMVGGEKVQFDIEQDPKGARARNVEPG